MQIVNEKDSQNIKEPCFYLKLIGITASALAKNNGQLPDLSQVIGYFVVGEADKMRAQLHNFIDQACDAWEGANEKKP